MASGIRAAMSEQSGAAPCERVCDVVVIGGGPVGLDTAPWGAHAISADFHAVPQVFFCDPETTAVCLSAEQAEQPGHRVRAVDVELGKVKGASLYADGYRGRARMVVDVNHGYLPGVTFVGPAVAELHHSATVAVTGRV